MANEEPEKNDLTIQKLELLKWDSASADRSLVAVYEHVIRLGTAAASWYNAAKRGKKFGAYHLRLWAILITAAAGIVPILAEIWKGANGPKIPPGVASILLLVSATLIFLDQFLGCSSGWMRYMKTHMQIRSALEQLEFAFAIERSTWEGKPPTPEQVQRSLVHLKNVAAQVGEIVMGETNEWIAEFRTALRQIEEASKAAAEKAKTGGINLTVTNGADCTAGWSVAVNDAPPRICAGKSAALSQLPAGLRKLTVEGVIAGTAKRAEAVVTVSGGEATAVGLTLA